MKLSRGAPAALLVALLLFPLQTAEARHQGDSAEAALKWLRGRMNEDGSIPGFSPIASTAETVFAIKAGGQDPSTWRSRSGNTPISYLEQRADDDTSQTEPRDDSATAAEVAIAAVIAGRDPRSFGGANLIEMINARYDPETGAYGDSSGGDMFDQNLSIIALIAAGEPVPPEAVQRVLELQAEDGGWEFDEFFGTDTNTTSLAIQALTSYRSSSNSHDHEIASALERAIGFLDASQNPDGGFAYQASSEGFCNPCPSDANSTAFVIQAVRAAGEDPEQGRWIGARGGTPVTQLIRHQKPDGSFGWQENDSGAEFATIQAIPGVKEASLNCLIGLQACPPETRSHYWLTAEDGGIFTFGGAPFRGSQGGRSLNAPVVAMQGTPDGAGYWLVATDGGVFTHGTAGFFGSQGGTPLAGPVVDIASTPDGNGYWLVGSDGGVFSHGNAQFFGSAAHMRLAAPIVAIVATPNGGGYWLFGADGGVFAFGNAPFHGSFAGGVTAPIADADIVPDGSGYFLAGVDGEVYPRGPGAGFYGNASSMQLGGPITGIAVSPTGFGYLLAGTDGGVLTYGDVSFEGSMGGTRLAAEVTGIDAIGS